MTTRFFIPPEQIHNNNFILLGSEARHAAVVLRKKAGDAIDLFDGKDLSYRGRIHSVSPQRVEGVILARQNEARACVCGLTLYQALIKGPKWDWLVEKACEIGVTRLVPVATARTVVHASRESARERWKRIALAAAKQCGRRDVMEIGEPMAFAAAIDDLPADGLALIPWEKEQERTIRAAVSISHMRPLNLSSPAPTPSVAVFIGPEGGWEPQEVDSAVHHGVVTVTLGPTLLRSETAGLVAAALVLAEVGSLS